MPRCLEKLNLFRSHAPAVNARRCQNLSRRELQEASKQICTHEPWPAGSRSPHNIPCTPCPVMLVRREIEGGL